MRTHGAAIASRRAYISLTVRDQPARRRWHLRQITDEIEPSERGRHVLGARRKSERETRKPRCAKPSAPKQSRRRMKPILHRKKSKAEAQLVAGFKSSVPTEFNATVDSPVKRRTKRKSSIHINTHEGLIRVTCIAVQANGLRSDINLSKVGRSQWRRVRCAATEKRRSRSRTRTRRKAPKRPHRLPACTARPNSVPRTRANTARSTSRRSLRPPSACSLPFRRRSRQHQGAYFGIRSEDSRTIERPTRTIQRAR
jgi:hypothetical protein